MTTTPPSTTVTEYNDILNEFFKSMTPSEVTEHLMCQHCAATRNESELIPMTVAQDIAANGCIAGFVQAMYELWMRQKVAQMQEKE